MTAAWQTVHSRGQGRKQEDSDTKAPCSRVGRRRWRERWKGCASPGLNVEGGVTSQGLGVGGWGQRGLGQTRQDSMGTARYIAAVTEKEKEAERGTSHAKHGGYTSS